MGLKIQATAFRFHHEMEIQIFILNSIWGERYDDFVFVGYQEKHINPQNNPHRCAALH